MDTQEQITELQNRLDALSSSSTIPRNVEMAFSTRLGTGNVIYGRGTMTAGILDIYDTRITINSIAVATVHNSSGLDTYNLSSNANNGYVRIFEGGFVQGWAIDYIIYLK